MKSSPALFARAFFSVFSLRLQQRLCLSVEVFSLFARWIYTLPTLLYTGLLHLVDRQTAGQMNGCWVQWQVDIPFALLCVLGLKFANIKLEGKTL